MCNLGMAVQLRGEERGIAKGMEIGRVEGLLSSIKNLMETLKLTAQQAMDALKVPKEEQAHYTEMLGSSD